jgi:hypothetical protein
VQSPDPLHLQDEFAGASDRDEVDAEDPVLGATRDYLRDLKAPLYQQLSTKAHEVSAITSAKPVRSYAADGEINFYTPEVLAQRCVAGDVQQSQG